MKKYLQIFAVAIAIAAAVQVVYSFTKENTAYAAPGADPGT